MCYTAYITRTVLASQDYDIAATDRLVVNDIQRSERTPFERDRARIIHSSALRRLGTKTQVMTANYDDFVRTRLTHSLEVAQVGRDLANQIGCDPNIVDAACLAHDLGHPPFGHNGENVLNDIARGIGGFEGNAQTFRILTRLEPKVFTDETNNIASPNIKHLGRSFGLNLTRATLDAVCKYPWKQSQILEFTGKTDYNKFNIYDDDWEVFDWIRNVGSEYANIAQNTKCIEAQIMDLADDISYSTHDIEDAIVTGVMGQTSLDFVLDTQKMRHVKEVNRTWYGNAFSDEEVVAAARRLHSEGLLSIIFDGSRRSYANIKNMTSGFIGRFCNTVTKATVEAYNDVKRVRFNASLVIPRDIEAEIHLLKLISAAFMMNPRNASDGHKTEKRIIYGLAESYQNNPNLLETQFKLDYCQAENDAEKLRIIVDQIACLTDISAKRTFESVLY